MAEPKPIKNDRPPVWPMVIEDMKARDKMGHAKYGIRLQPGNGRYALQDAYEESLDQTVYIKQEIEERKASDLEETYHHNMVSALAADPLAVGTTLRNLTANQINILHAAIGMVTEAGELLDAVKKAIFYDAGFDLTNVLEEMGDIEFYMDLCRTSTHLTRSRVLKANFDKLNKRYRDGKWTKQGAVDRDLDAEREALSSGDATGVPG